jgi:predicted lipoprotein with Yx(FWY)xxD motif
MTFKTLALTALLTSVAALAQAQPAFKGGVLTDPAGRTLYVFDKDTANTSNCGGPCLQAWPAYTAEPQAGTAAAAEASRFARDGAKQWAWNGQPLYYFAGDAKPGDQAGDGSGNVWHIVKPGKPAKAAKPAKTDTWGY